MKKILSFIVVAMMLMATVLTASAAPTAVGTIGVVPVLYAKSDMITIDGTVDAAEWDETNSIMLSCKTNMATWTTDYPGEIQFFYSWGDDGIYMAAKVIDSTLTFTTMNAEGEEGGFQDRFQIAFNPCGLIYEKAKGLCFSFYPVCEEGTELKAGATGDLHARKHDFAESDDESESIVGVTGFKGAFKVTEDGWDMEAILPWNLISSQDRVYDIIDFDTEGAFCSVLDPKNEDRTRAFTKAFIAYVDNKELDDPSPNTGRTATAADQANNWNGDSYDITLKFYMEGESTDDKTVTPYTVDELKAIFTDVDWTDYDEAQNPDTSDDEEDDPDANDTAAGNEETDAATNAPATGNDSASTTTGDSADKDGGSPVIWIVIAAVAVVAIAAVAIVISKKKK